MASVLAIVKSGGSPDSFSVRPVANSPVGRTREDMLIQPRKNLLLFPLHACRTKKPLSRWKGCGMGNVPCPVQTFKVECLHYAWYYCVERFSGAILAPPHPESTNGNARKRSNEQRRLFGALNHFRVMKSTGNGRRLCCCSGYPRFTPMSSHEMFGCDQLPHFGSQGPIVTPRHTPVQNDSSFLQGGKAM